MSNLNKILEKHNFQRKIIHLDNFVGEDIVDIIKDALIEFTLEYDFNPCTRKEEIKRCAIEFCKPEKPISTYMDEECNVKINYE